MVPGGRTRAKALAARPFITASTAPTAAPAASVAASQLPGETAVSGSSSAYSPAKPRQPRAIGRAVDCLDLGVGCGARRLDADAVNRRAPELTHDRVEARRRLDVAGPGS